MLVLAVSAFAVHVSRTRLAEPFHRLKVTRDSYSLPSPKQTVLLSLGYRAALADLIYAHVLVDYGVHFQEKRLFETVGAYLDTVNELDPKFATPYYFADTLLVLQPVAPPLEHYHQARRILLRGTRELPFDPQLWMSAGQYLAYLAPSHLKDAELEQAWKMEGARLMMRACELQSNKENIPFVCLTAAGILNRAGRHEANVRFLQRFLAVNEDPEVRAKAMAYLRQAQEALRAAQGQSLIELHAQHFEAAWRRDLGFGTADMALVVGPGFDPVWCAAPNADCATAWRDVESPASH